MSRIGKLPITIPENVDVNYNESEITVKGKFGTLQTKIPDIINITQDEIIFKCKFKI
jgi:large subunit ribosomal protein L6